MAITPNATQTKRESAMSKNVNMTQILNSIPQPASAQKAVLSRPIKVNESYEFVYIARNGARQWVCYEPETKTLQEANETIKDLNISENFEMLANGEYVLLIERDDSPAGHARKGNIAFVEDLMS